MTVWTGEEIAAVRHGYRAGLDDRQIAEHLLGRSPENVAQLRKRHGLKKQRLLQLPVPLKSEELQQRSDFKAMDAAFVKAMMAAIIDGREHMPPPPMEFESDFVPARIDPRVTVTLPRRTPQDPPKPKPTITWAAEKISFGRTSMVDFSHVPLARLKDDQCRFIAYDNQFCCDKIAPGPAPYCAHHMAICHPAYSRREPAHV